MAGEGERAKVGDTVLVHYTGKLEDGIPFDSSIGSEPLEFTIGAGRMIPGFEEAVIGMAPGESKVVKIPPEKGYGLYREDRVIDMNLKDFPEDIKPEIGMVLQVCEPSGRAIPVQVTDVVGDIVTLDANHPLSERTLTFEIQLVGIEPTTEKTEKEPEK